jgi:hypothetical protein
MHLQELSIGVLLYKLTSFDAQQISLYSMMPSCTVSQKETTKGTVIKIPVSNIGKSTDFSIYRRKYIEFGTKQKNLLHILTKNCPFMVNSISWHRPFLGFEFDAI